MNRNHRLTTISISHDNYLALKQLGQTGDSFNDVLSRIIKKIENDTRPLQIGLPVGEPVGHSAVDATTTIPRGEGESSA